jgi:hypothetical protein
MEWTREPMHRNIVALLFGITGMFWLFIGGAISFLAPLFEGLLSDSLQPDEMWLQKFFNLGINLIGVLFIVFALLSILTAVLVYNRKVFGYYMGIVISVFRAFSFPIGTAISVYSIVVLVNQPELKGNTTEL